MQLPSFLFDLAASDFVQLVVVLLLTLPIAYNRERANKIMGLRTFPLVGIGTCAIVLIAETFIEPANGDGKARIIQGLLAGIGFIGGGAILKRDDKVLGTASAASIWVTGAMGIAVAYARYEIALFLSLSNYLILRWITPLKERLADEERPAEP